MTKNLIKTTKDNRRVNFLSIKEVANILNVPKRTVYRWAVSGILPCYKFGSTYKIYHDDFNAFLAQSKIEVQSSS